MTLGRWRLAVAGAALALTSLGGQFGRAGGHHHGTRHREGGWPAAPRCARDRHRHKRCPRARLKTASTRCATCPRARVTIQVLARRLPVAEANRDSHRRRNGHRRLRARSRGRAARGSRHDGDRPGAKGRARKRDLDTRRRGAKATENTEISTTADLLTAKAPGVIVLAGLDARRRADRPRSRRLVDQLEQRADLGTSTACASRPTTLNSGHRHAASRCSTPSTPKRSRTSRS